MRMNTILFTDYIRNTIYLFLAKVCLLKFLMPSCSKSRLPRVQNCSVSVVPTVHRVVSKVFIHSSVKMREEQKVEKEKSSSPSRVVSR